MAHDDEIQSLNLNKNHRGTISRWTTPRRKILSRKRKVPTVRLGGKKPRRGFFALRLIRRIRLRWLKLQYSCMLKKLKNYYDKVVKELIEAGATFDNVQNQFMLESYYAVPVMGLSVAIGSSNRNRARLIN